MPEGRGAEIHTWYYTGKPVPLEKFEDHPSWLDRKEQERAQRLARSSDRDEFIYSHLFLRKVLSLYTGTSPQEIVLSHHPSGKSFLDHPSAQRLLFSMSRSKGAVAVAVSNSIDMGIDLERIHEGMPWKDMASSHFPPGEAEMIADNSDPLKTFYRHWTLREAALKYLGTGLSIPPEKVKVSIPQEGGETFSTITFSSVGFSDILTGVSILEDDLMLSLVFKADREGQLPELDFR